MQEVYMDNLILVKPSKELEKDILDYRQEFLDYGEKHINGSCGLSHYDNFDEWLDIALSIEKDRLSRIMYMPVHIFQSGNRIKELLVQYSCVIGLPRSWKSTVAISVMGFAHQKEERDMASNSLRWYWIRPGSL